MSKQKVVYQSTIKTPLGDMIAIADNEELYLLEFVGRRGLARELERLKIIQNATIVLGRSQPLDSIENELMHYFNGELSRFTTPIHYLGTNFQRQVWEALQAIPYGETCSYAELARAIDKPTAYRACANANGANQLAIIIPCHRVINANGEMGGYGGGVDKKTWLLEHERHHSV